MVTDPKGKVLTKEENQEVMRYQWTSFMGGNFQICIYNKGQREEEYKFRLRTGVEAKDYSQVITKKHLKPVEVQATKLQDHIKQLKQELNFLVRQEEQIIMEQNSKIAHRVLILGAISVAVVGISTYLQI
mmetsp:Transcript_16934/g.12110  ORF Transcript_16934/g.12110 Transcript_16934/m.12110 type:complete len:130 (+) Transcript_16934:152-541(+)